MKPRIELILVVALVLWLVACGYQVITQTVPGSGSPMLPILPDCNQAELISETIQAGTKYQAGEKFDKTWIIRNVSQCEWSYQYSLVYYDGVGMGASTNRVMTENMPPGATIKPGEDATITLNLRAPYAPGNQVGYWKLRDPSGMLFMPLNVPEDSLSVDIDIVGTIYSFTDNLCQADWDLDGKPLACPLSEVEDSVSFFTDHFPHLEIGGVENEPAVGVLLPAREGSTLTATFPQQDIQMGDHLHVITACAFETPQCNLTFSIRYIDDSGSVLLGDWQETSDNQIQTIDRDISDLMGKKIRFVFSVSSNTSAEGNRGYWFFPVLLPY